jgi:hypothetical protein
LLYDLNPLPREFGYLGIGFEVSYHSYLSIYPQHSPIRDSVTIFIVSYQWDEDPFCYGSHNTGFSYKLCKGLPCNGSHYTGFRYQWGEGLLATVVIIPGSVTSEGLTARHHVLLYFPLINKILI